MAIRADLDALRAMLGSKTTTDDKILGVCLEASGAWVYDRVRPESVRKPEVAQAVLLLAARLYDGCPGGCGGMGGRGRGPRRRP